MTRESTMANQSRRQFLAFSIGPALVAMSGTAAAGAGVTAAEGSARASIRNRYFPDVVLQTHLGRRVRFYEDLIRDKIVVINMMYARCEGICPGVTANLVKVQRLLGDRVGRDTFFYSITIKPEADSPRVLARYAREHRVGPGWLFLTGAPRDIELLRHSLGFVDPDPKVDQDKSNHIGNIRYGNEGRTLWGACPGLMRPAAIAKSIAWVSRSPAQNMADLAGRPQAPPDPPSPLVGVGSPGHPR
jgi:protein SCO1/2